MTSQLNSCCSGDDLEVGVISTSDAFMLNNWYLGSQYHVEQFKTDAGHVLVGGQSAGDRELPTGAPT